MATNTITLDKKLYYRSLNMHKDYISEMVCKFMHSVNERAYVTAGAYLDVIQEILDLTGDLDYAGENQLIQEGEENVQDN